MQRFLDDVYSNINSISTATNETMVDLRNLQLSF